MQAQGQRTAILSSLPLQILLYFDNWFIKGFLIYNLLLYVYKGARRRGTRSGRRKSTRARAQGASCTTRATSSGSRSRSRS